MTSLLLFGAVITYLQFSETSATEAEKDMLVYIPGIIFLTAVPFSTFMFKKNTAAIKSSSGSLQGKLATYQTAHIVRMASFETVGLFAVVICQITGTLLNLGVLVIVLAYFTIKIPRASLLETELELSNDEINQLKQ